MILMVFAFLAGIALATQATLNSSLGQLLQNSLLATLIAFGGSFAFTTLAFYIYVKEYPSIALIKEVPWYLWFSGSFLSACALALFYYLIPKIGILPLVSFSLAGQLFFSVVCGHFGWFDLPVTTLGTSKILGVVLMLMAIFLINKG